METHGGVRLGTRGTPHEPGQLDGLAARAAATGGRLSAALPLVTEAASLVSPPGAGQTAHRWEVLASLAAGDLSVARVAEAHLDALAILAESGQPATDPAGSWGVFAAEGPGVRVDATKTREGWRLSGTKPWCSAASGLDRALLTAHVGSGRRLFAIDLHDPTVVTESSGWVSRGLSEVVSGPIQLADTPATPIGEPGWYLTRPGFAWGGVGVAACWYGGTVALARTLWTAAKRREPDQIALLLLGTVDRYVEAARHALLAAAGSIDQEPPDPAEAIIRAERVRGTVAAAADEVLTAVAHGLGPAPLAMNEEHARRVADLQIYLRQHHAERDTARLGGLLLEGEDLPW